MTPTSEENKNLWAIYSVMWPMGKAKVRIKAFKQPHVAKLIIQGWASKWLGVDFSEITVV